MVTTSSRRTALAFAGAVIAATSLAGAAHAGDMAGKENCYGVALKGQNDLQGRSRHQLSIAWTLVEAGACLKIGKSAEAP